MSNPNQHLRVPPAYAASLNSDFSTSDVVSSTVPQYSRSASPDERVLAGNSVRTFSALSTGELPSYFKFATQHATLDLGERTWYCPLPCYGYASVIEGTVQVHQVETVAKVEISLIGEITTTVSEAAVPSQGASKKFFKQKITLWDSSASGSGQQSSHRLTISFPDESSSSTASLPPSCRFVTSSASARVLYKLQVDLFRKGLRRHKRFETEVLYLPKSFAAPLQIRPMHIETKSGDSDSWTRHLLMPAQSFGRASASNTEVPREMVAELFLPSQTVISATSIIPYTMRIYSASSASSNAAHNPASLALVQIDTQIIKSTIVLVHGIRKRKDVILASGVVSSDYQGVSGDDGDPDSNANPTDTVRVINGSVEIGGRSGSELSWEFQNFVEVKYYLIATAKPPSNVRALEGVFPTFQVNIELIMKTHTRHEEFQSTDHIDTDPSVGLFDAALNDARSI